MLSLWSKQLKMLFCLISTTPLRLMVQWRHTSTHPLSEHYMKPVKAANPPPPVSTEQDATENRRIEQRFIGRPAHNPVSIASVEL
jgi:hypothetical protein